MLWDGPPPADPTSAVHNLVSRLRQPSGPQAAKQARERLSTTPQAAAAWLEEALTLWRGPAYAEFADEEFAKSEVARLEAAQPLGHRPRGQLMIALHRTGRSGGAGNLPQLSFAMIA